MTDPVPFDSTTPRLSLPLLFPGQAQKEGFVNEIAARLDALVHCAIEAAAATPPTAPEEGQCWLIASGASGAWFGHDDEIAAWQGGNWLFFAPREGMSVFDKASAAMRRFAGSWAGAERPAEPAGGTTIDAEARTAISQLIEVLEISGLLGPA